MTKYFIMTKNENNCIYDNSQNQIIDMNNKQTFILPRNMISIYASRGLYEDRLIEWCKQLCDKNKIMLDIGSHTGTYTISLANYCKEIHSFEPQKQTFYALCGSVALSGLTNITCHNIGLGSIEQSGKQKLNIMSEDGGGSSLHDNNHIILGVEEIHVKTLDEMNLDNIGFIKIDVENNEKNVILGGKITLQKNNYPKILFESNDINHELFDLIKNIGYTNIINIGGYKNMFLAEK